MAYVRPPFTEHRIMAEILLEQSEEESLRDSDRSDLRERALLHILFDISDMLQEMRPDQYADEKIMGHPNGPD